MPGKKRKQLTRREEQIMAVLYRRGEASVADLERSLPDPPTSGALRRLLNLLHAKGAIEYRQDGARKIYRATVRRDEAGGRALQHVVETFFAGSAASAMGALYDDKKLKLTREERELLAELIQKAKDKGR